VKSGSHKCRGENGLGVLSSELGCVSRLGSRLSLFGVACEPFGILGVLSVLAVLLVRWDTCRDLWG